MVGFYDYLRTLLSILSVVRYNFPYQSCYVLLHRLYQLNARESIVEMQMVEHSMHEFAGHGIGLEGSLQLGVDSLAGFEKLRVGQFEFDEHNFHEGGMETFATDELQVPDLPDQFGSRHLILFFDRLLVPITEVPEMGHLHLIAADLLF